MSHLNPEMHIHPWIDRKVQVVTVVDDKGRTIGDRGQRLFASVMGLALRTDAKLLELAPDIRQAMTGLIGFIGHNSVDHTYKAIQSWSTHTPASVPQRDFQKALDATLIYLNRWMRDKTLPLAVGRAPRDMSIEELLVLLKEQPANYSWLGPYLLARPDIVAVEQTTLLWVVARGRKDHPVQADIDIAATLDFIHEVNTAGLPPSELLPHMRRTIDKSMIHFWPRAIQHPITGEPVFGNEGLDKGRHLGDVPLERLSALHWAYHEQSHYVRNSSTKELFDRLFARPGPEEIKLVEAFRRARKNSFILQQRYANRFHPDTAMPNGDGRFPEILE